MTQMMVRFGELLLAVLSQENLLFDELVSAEQYLVYHSRHGNHTAHYCTHHR